MALNKQSERGVQLTIAAPTAPNAGKGPISGDPLVIGRGASPQFGLACVAESSYTPPTGTPTGNIAVSFEGVYFLQVKAKASFGGAGQALNPGDKVYADNDGLVDLTTGVYYGFSLTGNATSGIYFGNVLDAIASGLTVTARVRLKVSGN